MSFETFFKLSSYTLLTAGLLALIVSGGVGIVVTLVFVVAAVTAWFLEGTKWQLSERLGLILIFALLPLFYLNYKYTLDGGGAKDQAAIAVLARLILALAAIKLLQVKNDRDWFVLYIISFFEVLLAAGFSISPFLAVTFVIYLFLAVTTIIAFEVKKSFRNINETRAKILKSVQDRPEQKNILALPKANFRFPVVAVNLLILTLALAVPLFFFLPRVGGAGLGSGGRGLTTSTGFSDTVTLGAIANIQQSNEVVMRVKIEGGIRPNFQNFKWRGVALDIFDKKIWSKSRGIVQTFGAIEDNLYKLDNESGNNRTVLQTIYLEPLDTPTLFGLPRMLGIQGNFESISRDHNEAISAGRTDPERINYKVISDTYLPREALLRQDNAAYPQDKNIYFQLPPRMDERFAKLTREIIEKSGAKNRYDSAKAVESYLQDNFGYTLDLKAGRDNPNDPLADFLFNVKEGHCEYFASAMAIMLRTQGIATRVVNGFQTGQYNETAGMYIVRQKNAHSWVEVYFPGEKTWVPFDPTPAGSAGESAPVTGLLGAFGNYIEALETLWIQYVVAYDDQGQKSLARSFRQQTQAYMTQFTNWSNAGLNQAQKTLSELTGREGYSKQVNAGVTILLVFIVAITLIILLINFVRYVRRSGWLSKIGGWFRRRDESRVIEFYGRMIEALKEKGLMRPPYQTPIEFAGSLAIPEAIKITEAYNLVRFGEKLLTREDISDIEAWLSGLEKKS